MAGKKETIIPILTEIRSKKEAALRAHFGDHYIVWYHKWGPFFGPLFGSPNVNVGKPRPPNDGIPERILCSILQQNIQENTPALRKVIQESIATRDPACSVLDFKIHCISCCVLDNSNTIDHLITKYISHQNLPRLGLELYQSNEKTFACGLIPPMSNTTSVGGRIKDPFPWSSHRPFSVHRNKNTKRLSFLRRRPVTKSLPTATFGEIIFRKKSYR